MIEIIDLRYSKNPEFLKELKERAAVDFKDYERVVQNILARVEQEGDLALLGYTEKFDGADLSDKGMKVTDAEIDEAYEQISEDFLRAIRLAI